MSEAAAEPDIFDEIEDDDVITEGELRAEADIAAGRLISHEAVKRWVLSWGTPDELSRPECGE